MLTSYKSFGDKAVTNFLTSQGYSYIMRAHEAHAEGVAISKGKRSTYIAYFVQVFSHDNDLRCPCIHCVQHFKRS